MKLQAWQIVLRIFDTEVDSSNFFIAIYEEVCRREKQAGIISEPEIDSYMKVSYVVQESVGH